MKCMEGFKKNLHRDHRSVGVNVNFRALVKSESWKSPENLFWKIVANPVLRMQPFYFLIFMGQVIPKI